MFVPRTAKRESMCEMGREEAGSITPRETKGYEDPGWYDHLARTVATVGRKKWKETQ